MKIRKEILEFAEVMEDVMRINDDKKGDSWKDCEISFLESKLIVDFAEWLQTRNYNLSKNEVIDIANYCMMLFHRYDEIQK